MSTLDVRGLLQSMSSPFTVEQVEQRAVRVVSVVSVEALQERLGQQLRQSQQRTAEAEARAAALSDKLTEVEASLSDLRASHSEELNLLRAQLEEAQSAQSAQAAEAQVVEDVTDDERSQARRLAEALLEDLLDEQGEAAQAALKAGTVREVLAEPLEAARQQYARRVRAPVRGEADHWGAAIDALQARAQG